MAKLALKWLLLDFFDELARTLRGVPSCRFIENMKVALVSFLINI